MSVNKVIIIGNLGADPEVRYTQGGQPVCNLRVATSEKWKDRDGNQQERTEWHTIVVWGKQAESCGQYLSKGRQVYVEGSLQSREYEKDGNTVKAWEVKAHSVTFLGGRDDGGGQGGGGQQGGGQQGGGGGGGGWNQGGGGGQRGGGQRQGGSQGWGGGQQQGGGQQGGGQQQGGGGGENPDPIPF